MKTLISFIIFSLILTYVYRKLHRYWVKFFGSNSKNTKKNKNKKKGNHKSNQNVSSGIIKSYVLPRLISANERRSASYEQVTPVQLDPDQSPSSLPRSPIFKMAKSPVRKSNRRLSPWGGTIGDDYE